jgi:hypothetical protein
LALAAVMTTVLLSTAPVAAQPLDVWQPVGAAIGEPLDLHVEPGEPAVLYAVRNGALWRLEGEEDGSWEPMPVLEPQDRNNDDGSRLVVTEARIDGFWQAARQPELMIVSWLYDYEIRLGDVVLTSDTSGELIESRDGGQTWDLVLGGFQTSALSFSPSEPLVVYASFTDPQRNPTTAPFATRFDENRNRNDLAMVAPDATDTLRQIEVDAADTARIYAFPSDGTLYRSDDGGESWQETTLPAPITALATHPTVPGILLAGSIDGLLWRSDDFGASWSELTTLANEPEVTIVALDPIDTQRLYAIGGGVVYASDTAGQDWQSLGPGLPATAVVLDVAVDAADPSRLFAGVGGAGVWRLDRTYPPAPCVADDDTLCLGDAGRFEVRAQWYDFTAGTGRAEVAPLDSDDTGAFYFFNDENLELLVKALDGRPINDRFWVFYGALSNVRFTLLVTDTLSGETIGYHNPTMRFASRGDTTAFPEDGSNESPEPGATAQPVAAATAPGLCVPSATVHCLNDGRFQAEVAWADFTGGTGTGTTVPATDDTGIFWFFREDNLELAVKLLDGNWWVFYGALTNVEFTLTVTDTVTGDVLTYENPSGNFASRGDTTAFESGVLP